GRRPPPGRPARARHGRRERRQPAANRRRDDVGEIEEVASRHIRVPPRSAMRARSDGMSLPVLLTVVLALAQARAPSTPEAAAAGLLEADRAFAAAAAGKPAVDAISAMFADDVTVPAPGNVFVQGRANALEALKASPDNVTAR